VSANDHLGPQFDELAARKAKKFSDILSQVPSFDDRLEAAEKEHKASVKPKRPNLRVVK
jgi:hypothetical protein